MLRTVRSASSRRHLLIVMILVLCICSLAVHFIAESLISSTVLFVEMSGHPGDHFVLSTPPLPIFGTMLLIGFASVMMTRLVSRTTPILPPPNC
jgi:hypothetical protein